MKSLPAAQRAERQARILLVDDDERNLLALSQVLEPLGEIVTATSGPDALRQLLKQDFAVILLDVFMPDMDGYETARLIRAREQTSKIPIIFASAVNKETEHLMRGYTMGAVDYVFKPIDPIILRSKVAVFVDLYDMRQQVLEKARAEQDLREARYRAEAERLHMERELQKTRRRQASILDAVPLALYEAQIDANGSLVRRFVGGDLEKLIADDAARLVAGELTWESRIPEEDLTAICERLLTSGPSTPLHYRWRRSDGEILHVFEHAVRVDPHSAEFVGTVIDNTQQRRLEQQLLQAGKLDAIGQLTGGIAHDFNNLLAAVLGGMNLLERRLTLSEREQHILAQMRHAAEKGVELVRRMMAFARRQDLHPSSIAPDALCQSVAALIEQTLGGSYTVCWDCGGSEQNFFADQAQLELAVLNLIINARDAMPEGGAINVAVADAGSADILRAGLRPGSYLSIRVTDHGTGIPRALVDKITEPFFTTKDIGKGTGLGLSMVQGFVAQSGGKILIESEEGVGTTIEIFLPATGDAQSTGTGQAASPQHSLPVRTLLLVDDDEAVRLIMSEQLTELGIDVHPVADGETAIRRLTDTPGKFDFVLSDFAMPGLNGLETLKRALEIDGNLGVAIMTGHAEVEPIASILTLKKPVSMAALQSAFRQTVAQRPARSTA